MQIVTSPEGRALVGVDKLTNAVPREKGTRLSLTGCPKASPMRQPANRVMRPHVIVSVAPEPQQPLVVHNQPLASQHDPQPPKSEAATLGRDLPTSDPH